MKQEPSLKLSITAHAHTHAHRTALLASPNDASHRRDAAAAAVATRERCGEGGASRQRRGEGRERGACVRIGRKQTLG